MRCEQEGALWTVGLCLWARSRELQTPLLMLCDASMAVALAERGLGGPCYPVGRTSSPTDLRSRLLCAISGLPD